MSLPADQVLISADDHLDIHAMPPDTWSRLPAAWRDRGPHVEETPEGPFWFCEGRRISPSGRKEAGYISANEHGFRPGQPQTRLEDLDRDGVRATVVYGPMCTQLQIKDAGLHQQVAQVYNDWAAEFQRQAPDRLILLPDIPPYDPQAAKAELQRCAKLGHRGAIVSSTVGRGKPLFDDEWAGFWDVAQEIGIPIHVHLAGVSAGSRTWSSGSITSCTSTARRSRTTASRCCRARSSRGRCTPRTRTRSSASS
jgi:predicted TIM-barrel fold metal-dependent hydrolase